MANELFYPHGQILGGTYLGQSEDLQVDANLDDLTLFASGDYAPSFTGAKEVAPEFSLDTFDAKGVFALVAAGNGGVDDLCKAYSAGNVDMAYRVAANLSTPAAAADAKHYVYRVINGSLFYWDSFRVNQKGEVQVKTKTVVIAVGANPIVTQLPNQPLTDPPLVTNVYTMGKIILDGSQINRIKSLNWDNNVRIVKEATDGEASPSFAGIEEIKPMVKADTANLAVINAFGFSGYRITTSFDVYLRKRKAGSINHADGEAVHIKLSATAGSVYFDSTAGKQATGKFSAMFERPAAGQKIWTITDGVTIP